jgi:hypothetical protein
VLEGGNLGSSRYCNMLLHTSLGRGAWHRGLGDAHPISRLPASPSSRFVPNPGSFRSVAKKHAEVSSYARLLQSSTETG